MDLSAQDFDDTSSVSSDATDFSVSLLNGLDFDDLATTRKIDTFSQFGPSQATFKTPIQSDHDDDAYMDEIFSQARGLTQILKWRNSLTPNTFLRKVCPDNDVSVVPDTPDTDFLEGAVSQVHIITPVKGNSSIAAAEPKMFLMSMPNQTFSPPSFESNTPEMFIVNDDGLQMPHSPRRETGLDDEKPSKSQQNESRTPIMSQEQKLDNLEDLPLRDKAPTSQKSSDERLKGYQTPIRLYLTVSPKTPPVGIVTPTPRSPPSVTIRRSRPVANKKVKPLKGPDATTKPVERVLFRRSVPKLRTPKSAGNNSLAQKGVSTSAVGPSSLQDPNSKYRALMHNYFQLTKKLKKEKKKRKSAVRKLVLQDFKGRKGKGPVTSGDQMALLSKTMSAMFQNVRTIYPRPPKVIERVSRISEIEKEAIREEVRTTKRDCDCLCFCGDQDKLKTDSPLDLHALLPPVTQQSMLMFSQYDYTV